MGPKRSKYDKVVVLENMFDPVEFEVKLLHVYSIISTCVHTCV